LAGQIRLSSLVATTSHVSLISNPGLSRCADRLSPGRRGRTNRQIGQALFITPKTASLHVSRILAKLGVAGRGEAAAVAHRLGLDKQ
jgi:DNA-binding CsgD family transcriptional regulator